MNQLALTLEEQHKRSLAPRPAEPFPDEWWDRFMATVLAKPEIRVPQLMDLLGPRIGESVFTLLKERT
jgi:hypothetical protein